MRIAFDSPRSATPLLLGKLSTVNYSDASYNTIGSSVVIGVLLQAGYSPCDIHHSTVGTGIFNEHFETGDTLPIREVLTPLLLNKYTHVPTLGDCPRLSITTYDSTLHSICELTATSHPELDLITACEMAYNYPGHGNDIVFCGSSYRDASYYRPFPLGETDHLYYGVTRDVACEVNDTPDIYYRYLWSIAQSQLKRNAPANSTQLTYPHFISNPERELCDTLYKRGTAL